MCSSQPEKPEAARKERYCGYCGERLPSLGTGMTSPCPNCSHKYGAEAGRRRRPRVESWWGDYRDYDYRPAGASLRFSFHRPPPPPDLEPDEVRFYGQDYHEHRDPLLATLLSVIFPGAGQVYNREFVKGLLVLVTSWLVLPYFLGIIDAYLSAKRKNRRYSAVAVWR